jgi:hypothetical protein
MRPSRIILAVRALLAAAAAREEHRRGERPREGARGGVAARQPTRRQLGYQDIWWSNW